MQLDIKNGLVNNRENTKLEFKSNFHHQNTKNYIKAIASFANNKGGQIIFGIQDKPRKPLGLSEDDFKIFNDFDTKKISRDIQDCLSQNIEFNLDNFSQNIDGEQKNFGLLTIKESSFKPVVCKQKDDNHKLRSSAIYFRYSAENTEIKAQDLISMINTEKEKERKSWLKYFEKIARIGISNTALLDIDSGEIQVGNKNIIIDSETIKKIKFIKEGEFVEKDGAPALILKGEIKNMESLEVVTYATDPNKTHKFDTSDLIKSLLDKDPKLNNIFVPVKNKSYNIKYIIQILKKKENVEDNISFCWKNTKGNIKQYSQAFSEYIFDYIKDTAKINLLFS